MKWEKVTLEKVCKIKTGKTPSTKIPDYYGGDINWYNPGDINGSKNLSESKRKLTKLSIEQNKAILFNPNSILLTCIGEIGKCGIIREYSSSNQQITALEFNKKVNPDYAYYWLINNKLKLKNKANDSLVPILNNASLKTINFNYPPLPVQKRIAEILDVADALRKKDAALLQKYDELLQSIFYDMFGDPVTNEKGWEVKKLGETLIAKPSLGTIKPVSDDGEYPIVRVGDLGQLSVDIKHCKKVSLNEKEYKKYRLIGNDLVLARAIGSIHHLGKASVFYNCSTPLLYDSHVMRLALDDKIMNVLFFYYWLKTDGGRARFLSKAGKTSVQYNINGKQIVQIEVPLPNVSLQNEFAVIVNKIESQKQKVIAQQQQSEALFQSLMQRAFKGELVG